MVTRDDTDKQKALEAALSQIDRAFGKGSVMKLGAKGTETMESYSTGSLGLDIALGIGGLPKGRIVEIYGPESSGKTTLALHTVAEAQKKGGICAFVDAERDVEPQRARGHRLDLDDLLVGAEPHDRTLAERPLDLRQRRVESLCFVHRLVVLYQPQ